MKSRNLKKIFITGATGFIGSALADYLVQQNLQVLCLVHRSPLKSGLSNIKTIQGDLVNFDWNILEKFQPDVICHFARATGSTEKERTDAAKKNEEANERLLWWLKQHPKPPLLVFGSGTLVYGDHGGGWVNESVPVNPISFQREYFKAEQPVLESLKNKSLPIIIVRSPWIYGAGSWFKWFFWSHMQKKKSVPLYGSGENYMSLIHVDDCVGMIHHIAEHGNTHFIYNITAHPPIQQSEFAEQIQKATGFPLKKYSNLRLWLRMEKAACEALTFSLKSASVHEDLTGSYKLKYPDLKEGLDSILQQLNE